MSVQNQTISELPDEEIIRGIRDGRIPQDSGLEELITRHTPNLWRYLTHRYRVEPALVDDAVANTALAIWDKFDQYDPDRGEFLPWAFTIGRRKLVDALRRQGRQEAHEISLTDLSEPEDDEANLYEVLATAEKAVEDQVVYKELEKRALEILMNFSDLDRTLFFLKSNYDLTFQELADILNKAAAAKNEITPDAVAKRFYRMRKKLVILFNAQK